MRKSTVRDNEEKAFKKMRSISKKELYASEACYRSYFESAKDGILILDAKTWKELAEIKKTADETNKFTEDIIDTIREPLLAIDKDLRVIKASRSFYKFFKVTADETIGQLIYELGNHQWDIPKLKELLENIIPEKNSFDDYEVEHHFSSIGKRVMLLNARQVKRAFGKEKVILLAIEDITERKGKEDTLKEKNRTISDSLHALLNHLNSPIIIWDASMIIKSFNHKFEQLSGYDSAEVIDKYIDFLFPKEKIAATVDLLKNHLADKPEVVEVEILTKDNTIKTVLWTSSRIFDEDGKEIIATISQDITEEKKFQNEIKFQADLLNNVGQAVIAADFAGKVIYWNHAAEKIYGWSTSEAIGKSTMDFMHPSEEQSTDIIKTSSAGKTWAGEIQVKRKDGSSFPAFLTNTPILDSNGKLNGFIGITKDITERKQAETELIEAKERAEESDRLKSAFLANMSHEIRTPMNSILGFTQLLLEPDLSSEEKEDYIEIVNQSGQLLLNTVTDIVEMSKIEAGLVHVSVKNFDFNERLENLFRFFQPEAYKKGLELSLDMLLPAKDKNISTDQNKLESILSNLIENAIKYTESGSIQMGCETLETLKTFGNRSSVRFYIKDTGIGIPKHRQEAIFDRFMQADISDSRAFQGSGLGLAISKSYVEMLGGKIWVESTVGKGSTFYFTLPVKNNIEDKLSEKVDILS